MGTTRQLAPSTLTVMESRKAPTIPTSPSPPFFANSDEDYDNGGHGLGDPQPGDVSGDYAGPGVNYGGFTVVAGQPTLAGNVLFTDPGGLPSGDEAYFALESPISSATLTVPEPATFSLIGFAAAGGRFAGHAKKKQLIQLNKL